jgi:hypothetical protein
MGRGPMYTCGLPLFKRHAVHSRPLPVPAAMRRLLHRPVDHQPDSWHAQWQAGCQLKRCHELPRQLRGVLHCPLDYEPDTRDA